MTIIILIMILIMKKYDGRATWRLLTFVRLNVSIKFLALMLGAIFIFFTKFFFPLPSSASENRSLHAFHETHLRIEYFRNFFAST